MAASSTRKCKGCGEIKALVVFHRNRTQPKGYGYRCKDCEKLRKHLYRTSEKGRKYLKEYRQSELGRRTAERYRNSDTYRNRVQSDRSKETRRRYQQSMNGKQKAKEWRLKHATRLRNWALIRKYNITVEDYEILLSRQDGRCAICNGQNKNGDNLSVDHNHKGGEVRGLVCKRCNYLIGIVEVETNKLDKIFDYLLQENYYETTNRPDDKERNSVATQS